MSMELANFVFALLIVIDDAQFYWPSTLILNAKMEVIHTRCGHLRQCGNGEALNMA